MVLTSCQDGIGKGVCWLDLSRLLQEEVGFEERG